VPVTQAKRRLVTLTVAALATVGLAQAYAVPASAAGVGYVRLAHFSPDTPAVDVYLSSQSGGGSPQRFNHVPYGMMSNYLSLPQGTYAVAMRPAGADPSSKPVLTTNVTVSQGKAYTVAGVGRYADLGLRILDDDLSLPTDGKAKVRIIQASVKAPVLNVAVENGAPIADGVQFATTTDYRSVNPGSWTCLVTPSGGEATKLKVSVAAGNVYSLLVLDAPGGGLSAQLRTDAQRSGPVPQGGVETGVRPAEPSRLPILLWSAVGLAVLAAGLVLAARFRQARARRF